MVWYAVRTAIKGEQIAADNLRKSGFAVYLPRQRIERWNKRSNTYRLIERPLLLRYLFVGLPPAAQHFGFVRACNGVERLLGDEADHPIAVDAKDVEAIYLAEVDMQFDDTRAASKHRAVSLDRQFPSGATVLVNKLENILHGVSATVVRTNGEDRIQIDLGPLGSPWVKPAEIVALKQG
nr:transcription termination/antitermination NusG family protein [Nitratireductor arenosus]